MTKQKPALAERLQQARELSRLTQQQVADELGIRRTAVAKLESGQRRVSDLELREMAKLYSRPLAWFGGEPEEDVRVALFRLAPQIRDEPNARESLDRYVQLCKKGYELKHRTGQNLACYAPEYDLPAPTMTEEAVHQGEAIAGAERRRLGLGNAPIPDMSDLIVAQGIWASAGSLPAGISGLFFRHSTIGLVILTAFDDQRKRKRFSYAHEYAHALMDRDGSVTVSTSGNRNQLTEVRANAFAAAFLMPADGIHGYVSSLDKGKPSRERHVLYDTFIGDREKPYVAERRHSVRRQRLTYPDVVDIAEYFDVNYDPVVFRLRNLDLISPEQVESLRAKKEVAARYLRMAFRKSADSGEKHGADRYLEGEIIGLVLEAFRRDEIDKDEVRALADLLRVDEEDLMSLAIAATTD